MATPPAAVVWRESERKATWMRTPDSGGSRSDCSTSTPGGSWRRSAAAGSPSSSWAGSTSAGCSGRRSPFAPPPTPSWAIVRSAEHHLAALTGVMRQHVCAAALAAEAEAWLIAGSGDADAATQHVASAVAGFTEAGLFGVAVPLARVAIMLGRSEAVADAIRVAAAASPGAFLEATADLVTGLDSRSPERRPRCRCGARPNRPGRDGSCRGGGGRSAVSGSGPRGGTPPSRAAGQIARGTGIAAEVGIERRHAS